ncbi:MAG: sensor histidine kinase [Bacteroidota bacterium]
MKSLFQILISAFALLIFGPSLWAQSAEQDALSNLVSRAWHLRKSAPKQAFAKANQALITAENLAYPELIAKSLYVMATIKHIEEEYPRAHELGIRAKKQYEANQNTQGVANALDLLGSITLKAEDFKLAANYYQEEISLILKNPSLNHYLAEAYTNYASLYQDMGFYQYALDYYQRAEENWGEAASEQQFTTRLNIAQVYFELGDFAKAKKYATEAHTFFTELGDRTMMAKSLNLKGGIALSEERGLEATQWFSEALSLVLNEAHPSVELHIVYLVNLAKSYQLEQKPKAALQAINKAYLLAQTQLDNPQLKLKCSIQLHDYYQWQADIDSTLKYLSITRDLENQIYDHKKELSVLLADTKIKTEQATKDLEKKEIQLSEAKNTQSYLYMGLATLGLVLVLIGGAFWQYDQKKKTEMELMLEKEKNQAQVLEGIIKEQELKSIGYIIEGQESEKKRVSEELHDGLGGTLAAIRISLEQFRRHLKKHEDIEVADFDYAFDLLREATEDVRRISHDMGAVRLKHGGLVTALADMCRNFSRHQSFVATIDTEGIEMLRIPNEVEFHLYRIAQELFQNIIKHAQASSVKIQLTNAGGRLHLYMWDDGKGFDIEAVADGMGMQNLKIRTQKLNGKIHIDSTIGKGTYTHISLPV